MPKNQNYLLVKADVRFFFSFGLRTTIKVTIFSIFYVTDNFSSCYGNEKTKKFPWNNSQKNLEDLLNTCQWFNQNVLYATITIQDIKIIIEELTVNIQIECF